jgi:hypothetical protein
MLASCQIEHISHYSVSLIYGILCTWTPTAAFKMVIGLLTLTAIPTVIGVGQGVSQQRQQNAEKADEKRMAKFYLEANCETKSSRAKDVHRKRVVLRDGKVEEPSRNYLHTCIPS